MKTSDVSQADSLHYFSLEADEVAVWVLAFDGAHRGGDSVFFAFGDAVAFCFDSAVLSGLEEPVAVAVPRAWRAA